MNTHKTSSQWPRNFTKQACDFFEPQLFELFLGEDQIRSQTLEELQDSLGCVNDALQNPELFGILKLKATASATILVSSQTESHIEIGVIPLLLRRKKLITTRLRELKGQRTTEDLSDLVESVNDNNLKERLLTELEALRAGS